VNAALRSFIMSVLTYGCNMSSRETACRTFEHRADPAAQMLNAWSTDYVTLRQLIDCLQSAGLLREASFILNLVQPPHPHTAATAGQSSQPVADHGNPSLDSNDNNQIAFTELISWTMYFNDTPVHSGGCLLGTGGYADVFKGFHEILRSVHLYNI